MNTKFELLKEFGMIIQITDLSIIVQGIRLDYIRLIPDDTKIEAQFWAGNMDDDKFANQILVDSEEERLLLERIWEEL